MKKVLGLILELNPYHKGHEYFIKKAIEKVNPDITIAIISSSFTMRGDPMVMDKFSKTKILLQNNIDIVLELPFISGVNSSDYFSKNCVDILNSFNVTDICFGTENDDLDYLQKLVELNESEIFNQTILKYINNGFSYSTASLKAIYDITLDNKIAESFSLPNNTLAIGYLKAINKTSIIPHVIKRIDNNYYDENLSEQYSSATAIRNELNLGNDISFQIPNYNYNFLKPYELENNLYKLLQYNLINNTNITSIKGINEGIENRLLNFINEKTYQDFIKNVITKRYSINKIKRIILYILLDIDKKYENKYLNYIRVLGIDEIGKKHISSLPKEIKKEIITSFKNNDNDLIQIELKATKLYGIITNNYNIYKEEFNIPYRKDNC